MRIDRLIGILSILLQTDMVTAPVLAEKFEVSKRTINRDIEELCKAGIPICTRQGQHGGISIMDNYKFDRTLLTSKEMKEILVGLQSLDSVSGNHQYSQLMEKLQAGSSDFLSGGQSILIDLSSWQKDSLTEKISQLRNAIDQLQYVTFEYYAPNGDTKRKVEPYYLIYHWASWYLWGWCTLRNDFRLFKLNRMNHIIQLQENFSKRSVPSPNFSSYDYFEQNIKATILFSADCKWRLIEEFGISSFQEQPDGKLLLIGDFSSADSVINWLLTFGDKAELLDPPYIRSQLRKVLDNLTNLYQK